MRHLYLGILLCALFSLPNLIVHDYPRRYSCWYAVELAVPGMEAAALFSGVSKMIGEGLLNISEVEQVFCEAGDGSALWLVQYPADTDQVFIHCEITRVLHQYKDALPYQFGPPRLCQLPAESPVLFAYLSFTPEKTRTLRLVCRELEEQILQLPGIREVAFIGVPGREIAVRLNPLLLQALRFHPMRVVHFIEGFLFQFSLGVWPSAAHRIDIHASTSIDSLEMLSALPIAMKEPPRESFCPLSEIADVQWAEPLSAQHVRQENRDGVLLRISYDSRRPLYQQILTRQSVTGLLENLSVEKRGIADCRIISAPSRRFLSPVILLCPACLIGLLFTFPERSPLYSTAAAGCNLAIHSIAQIPHTPVTAAGLAFGVLLVSFLPCTARVREENFFRSRNQNGILLLNFIPVLLTLAFLTLAFLTLALQIKVIANSGSTGMQSVILNDLLSYPFSWLREAGTTLVFGILIESLYRRSEDRLPFAMLSPGRNEVGDIILRPIMLLSAVAVLLLYSSALSAPGESVSLYASLPSGASVSLSVDRPIPAEAVSLDYPGGPPDISHLPIQTLLCRIQPQTRFLYSASPAAAAAPDIVQGHISLPLQYNPDELSSFLKEVLIPLQHHALKNDYEVIMRNEAGGTCSLSRRELFQQLSFAAEGVPAGTLYHRGDSEYYPVRVTYDIRGGISGLPALPIFASDGISRPLEEYAVLTCRKERAAYCCILP